MALTKVTYAMIDEATFSVSDFGAVGDGTTDDSVAIQAAIDAAAAAATVTSNRTSVRFSAGYNYKIGTSIQLKSVTIDATGASFYLVSNAGFLIYGDTSFISGSTVIKCETGYTGTVFKRDPALSGVGKVTMTGRPYIYKDGTLDTANGIAVDMTALYASTIDIQAYNFSVGIYANTTVNTQQTYYNRVSARCTGVFYGIRLRTDGFQGINGNSFDDISIGNCDIGIELVQGNVSADGPSANNFYINYIEDCNTYGIHLNGEAWHNTFIGGLIEPQNDVICIRNAGGKYNMFDMNIVPLSGNKGLESILGSAKNSYFLRRFGTFITWSEDVGPSSTYSTGTSTYTYVGDTKPPSYITHASATALIDISSGARTAVLSGSGTVTGVANTMGVLPVDELVIIGNGTATIQNNAATTYPFIIQGGANVTPPAEGRITFQRVNGYSNSWWELSRSF